MKKTVTTVLTIALTLSISTTGFAAANVNTPVPIAIGEAALQAPTVICMYGQVTKIQDNKIEVKQAGKEELIVLHISENTYLLDAVSGAPLDQELKVGDSVAAYYGPAVAASLPPQSTAVAIIANIPQDMGFPFYAKVEGVEPVEGGIKVTTDAGSRIITLTKDIIDVNAVKVDTELVLWYSMVTESIPFKGTARKAVLLNAENKTDKMILSTQAGVVSINGKEVPFRDEIMYEKEGTIMLPVRLLAETLGYEVNWMPEMNAVELRREARSALLRIGSTEYGVNKMRLVLAVAPEVKNGKTYVPSDFFEKALGVNLIVNTSHI